MESKNLTYHDYPVVRCGNEIYYGNMTDMYITMLKIVSTRKVGEVEIPTKVVVQLLYTDPDIKIESKVAKSSEKDCLAVAFDLATAWLGNNN